MRRALAVAGSIFVAAVATACGAAPSTSEGSATGVPPAEGTEGMISRTIVQQNDDGTKSIKTVSIPESQSRSEREARAERIAKMRAGIPVPLDNIVADTSCATSDMWMFSAAGCDESSDELCVYSNSTAQYRYATVDLANFCIYSPRLHTCVTTWDANVGSFWPGNDAGYFYAIHLNYGEGESFSALQSCTNADSIVSQADQLVFCTYPNNQSCYQF
jgi:hypothetical protein